MQQVSVCFSRKSKALQRQVHKDVGCVEGQAASGCFKAAFEEYCGLKTRASCFCCCNLRMSKSDGTILDLTVLENLENLRCRRSYSL